MSGPHVNGLLPMILPAEPCAILRRQFHERPGTTITVDTEGAGEIIREYGVLGR